MHDRYAADDDPEDINMYGNGDWMEPDIDGCNANGDAVEYDYKTQSYVLARNDDDDRTPYYGRSYAREIPKEYKWQFIDDEGLITSEIFQRCLGQSLAHKDREINSLREELLKPYWERRG